MKLVRELSEGMLLTFHRAFDVCSEAHDVALEKIISLRCDRLLTSGGAQSNVVHNLQALAAIQRQAAVRIVVIAAAGVSSDNVQRIIRDTGVRAVHAGSSVTKKISSSSVLEKPFGNKVKISCISVPISPKDSTGESYVDVAVDRVDSDDSRTAELANAHASSAGGVVGATASFSEELLCWNCVSEDLVYALVSEASTAFTTTTNSEDFANIGKDYSTGVVEGSYIHL